MPKITVIVPTYRPGSELDRLVASIDNQGMNEDDLEVLFVDDGSPDASWQRVAATAQGRHHFRAIRIEHSGWPSRPRNVGVRTAQGDFIAFADQDDTFYPGALSAAYDLAARSGADIVNGKEVRTEDATWGLTVYSGDIADASGKVPTNPLLPMTPHKLYRRDFLIDNEVTFPEEPRHVWEDLFFNITAFRHARVVSVLGATPYYHWRETGENNSADYGEDLAEHWHFVQRLFDHIDAQLGAPAHDEARRELLAHNFRLRVLAQYGDRFLEREPDEQESILQESRALLERFPAGLEDVLAPRDLAVLEALRTGSDEVVRELVAADAGVWGVGTLRGVRWDDATLTLSGDASWSGRSARGPRLRSQGDRVVRTLTPDVEAALDDRVLDVTDALGATRVDVIARHRSERTPWLLDGTTRTVLEETVVGGRAAATWSTGLAFDAVSNGHLLTAGTWDLLGHVQLLGWSSRRPLRTSVQPSAALVNGTAVIVFKNASGGASIDIGQCGRTVLGVSTVRWDDVVTERAGAGLLRFAVPIDGVHVVGTTTLAGTLELVPTAASTGSRRGIRTGRAPERDSRPVELVTDAHGVRLVGTLRRFEGEADMRVLFGPTEARTARRLVVRRGKVAFVPVASAEGDRQ